MAAVFDVLTNDERKVLHAVYALPSPMRLSILSATGLSNGRVTDALQSLREKGILIPREEAPKGQGRPSIRHHIAPDAFFAVGAALNVGSCRIVAVSGSGDLQESRSFSTEGRAFDETELQAMLQKIHGEVANLISLRGAAHCIGVGISVLGRVDTDRGIWLSGLQYGLFRNIDVVSAFEDLGVPIIVEDHARSIAFIEQRRGNPARNGSFVVLYLGEGLGSSFVLDGRIYRGAHGVAGEIGHITLGGNTRRCVCGDIGCLETVASGAGIAATVKTRIAEGVSSVLKPKIESSGRVNLDDILAAASQHDRLAQQVLQEAGMALGEACSVLMKIVNTPKIILSGEGTRLGEYLHEPMLRRIRERAPLESQLDFQIDFARYSENDESIGAAMLAIDTALSAEAESSTV